MPRAARRSSTASALDVHPLSPALGIEIRGLDLAQPLPAATIEEIKALWARHLVVVFPEQRLSEAQQVAFSRHFGDLAIFTDAEKRSTRAPEILRIGNVDEDGNRLDPDAVAPRYYRTLTGLWHTDGSYKAVPSMGSLLYAVEVPPEGGETCFANMFAAYAALPPAMKTKIAGRHMVHSYAATRLIVDGLPRVEEWQQRELPPVTHPLVRTHPDGRQSLYISANVAWYVGGMPLEEGQKLHVELMAHATQPAFVYCHRWRVGDLLMWDNRGALHRARIFDGRRYRRMMYRTEVMGREIPV